MITFRQRKTILAALLAFSCLSMVGCSNEDVGTLSGAALGGLIGNQVGSGSGRILATGVGAVAGAAIGNRIGASMDKSDQRAMQRALDSYPDAPPPSHYSSRRAPPPPASWTNHNTGARYTVRPTRTYYRQQGSRQEQCREYQSTAEIGGRREQVYGKACRQPDGSWKIVN